MSDKLRQAICDWIADCDQFEHEDDEADARGGKCDKRLLRWVERRYDGGLEGFLSDMEVV